MLKVVYNGFYRHSEVGAHTISLQPSRSRASFDSAPISQSIYLPTSLSAHLFIELPIGRIYLPVCQSSYLCIYLSIYLSIHRSIDLSIYLCAYLSIYPSIHPSISHSLSLSLSLSPCIGICLSVDRSLCPYIYPSISLCICSYVHLYPGLYVLLELIRPLRQLTVVLHAEVCRTMDEVHGYRVVLRVPGATGY